MWASVCVGCLLDYTCCGLVSMNTSMCVSVHMLTHMHASMYVYVSAHMLSVPAYGVGGYVHACRMTFSEMWQPEKKHLTHN